MLADSHRNTGSWNAWAKGRKWAPTTNTTHYPGMLADEDRAETFRTLHRLHAIRTTVRVVPTHDHGAARAIN